MACTREMILNLASQCVGIKEGSTEHKLICDTYNNHKPVARGYAISYKDAWCCCFVSYLSIECDATDIIPAEVGCNEQIKLFKAIGHTLTRGDAIPGCIVYYDWSGKQTNAQHVGIVEKVEGNTITVIEGNYSDSVKRRVIDQNNKYIMGFFHPHYITQESLNVIDKEEESKQHGDWQKMGMLYKDGDGCYKVGE